MAATPARDRFVGVDPDLERAVTLHWLPDRGRRPEDLLAVARALASVRHPNVVEVHDVIPVAGRPCLALERVRGTPLDTWIERDRPGWSALRRVLLSAADGLVAARDAGALHGALAADAIVVGPNGHATVVGFELPTPTTQSRADDVRAFFTVVRACAGHRLRRLSLPPEAGLPDLVRALAADQRSAGRRRTALVGALAAGLVAAGLIAWSPSDERCGSGAAQMQATWGDAERDALRVAFAETGSQLAGPAADRVVEALDGLAARWVEERRALCVSPPDDDAELELRSRCLDNQRRAMHGVVELLREPDVPMVAAGAKTVFSLEDVEACRLGDKSTNAAAVLLRDRLSMSRALHVAGRPAEARRVAREIAAQAEALGEPSIAAEASDALGFAVGLAGELPEAEALLARAVALAWRSGRYDVATRAWIHLAYLGASRLARPAAAWQYVEQASATLRRLGQAPLLHADVLSIRAMILSEQAQFERALREHERALALLQREGPAYEQRRGRVYNMIGTVQLRRGEYDAAVVAFERARAVWTRRLGPHHPDVAAVLANLAAVDHARGDFVRAGDRLEEAQKIREAAFGPEHFEVVAGLSSLGAVYIERGEYGRAQQIHDRALKILRATVRPDHPAVARAEHNMGVALLAQDQPDLANQHLERALAVFTASAGPDHPDTAQSLHSLGDVALARGEPSAALRYYRRARTGRERSLGPDHASVAAVDGDLGRALLEGGDVVAALAQLERALVSMERAGLPWADRGACLLALARARLLAGRPESAMAAAAAAHTVTAGHVQHAEVHRAARAWLEGQRGGSMGE